MKSFTVLANTGNYEYLTALTNISKFSSEYNECNINPNLDQPFEKARIETRTDIKAKMQRCLNG